MSALALPIQRAQNVVEAMAHDTPVVVYCMSCTRSKKFDPYLIAAKVRPLPFGTLAGSFPCKQCNERLAVVLPWYAPTPREWVKIARTPKEEANDADGFIHVEGKFAYRIDTWRTGHSDILKTLALIDNLDMGRAAFNIALEKYPREEIPMRQGAL